MHKLVEFICDELEELERKVAKEGKLSMAEIQYGDTLAHFEKSLLTSSAMKESEDWNGYSGARRRDSMGRYADGGNSYGRYYDDRRYSDGGYSGRRYSRDEGKSYMIRQFEKLMDDVSSQEEHEVLQSAINRLKNM